MSFTDIFIRRPVLATVVSLIILLLGIKSISTLQIRQYPELTNTVITITTAYPGATADLMQGFVTNPIQRSVASAAGVEYITSTSQQNVSIVKANIRLNFPPEQALTEVIAKVQEVNSELPKEIQSSVIKKETGESYAVLYVGFSSQEMTNQQITDFINRQIIPRLATLSGVASTETIGAQIFAMRIWVDPLKLASTNVSFNDLNYALQRNNYQSAPGDVKGYYVINNVVANTSLNTVDEFKNIIIKSVNGKVIRISDVATVELASKTYNSVAKMNDQKSVFIGIKTTPTGNPLTVVENVLKSLKDFEPNFPMDLKMKVAYDATKFIQASIDEVAKTLLEASVIVILVIFLFLGSIRAVFIPLITIPLSIIGVATVLLALGFSLNTLTLLAMVLAIGLVVDDAIVVVENVYRHLAEGQSPFNAALIGTREIAIPVITMTITLMAVYTPIAFMGGVTGALFREFALTLAGSVVISGIIALTLSPMMCSKLLTKASMESPFVHKVEGYFHKLSMAYAHRLKSIIRNRSFVVFGFIVIIGVSSFLTAFISNELAPQEDQGIVMMQAKGPKNANINYMEFYGDQLIKKMEAFDERDLSFAIMGMGEVNSGFAGLIFKPWNKRSRTSHEIQQKLQESISTIPGLDIFAFEPPSLPGNAGGLPVQFVINSMSDYHVIFKVMQDLIKEAKKSDLFFVTDSDLKFDNPTVKLKINRSKANQLGVSLQEIAYTLTLMMGESYTNRFNMLGKSYEVIPMAPRIDRLTPQSILSFYVRTQNGKQIPLSTFSTVSVDVEPNQLNQFNQINSATFQAFPKPWVKMGDVIKFLKDYGNTKLPAGFTYDYLSESRQYVQEGASLYVTFIFAVIMIYLVLAAQFESFRDPFIIMLSVPMSIFGALLVLFMGLSTLNIYSQIGLITLVGLITKHGILIVEFANQLQREEHLTQEKAIIKAATIRLRPILMTTAAMVVGLIPLVFSKGAGAASRFSIGITIIAGMMIGTFFTVFVVPSFYMMIGTKKAPIPIVDDGDIPNGENHLPKTL